MRRSSLPFVGFAAVLCFLFSAFSFASDGGLRDAVPMVFGSVWYVSTSGNDLTGDGSQDHPFRTIQKGIDSVDDGDTVLVEWGVYVENINFSGKRILVASHYIFDGLESTIESTIINGGHAGSVVTFNSGEGLNSVIRGFTLTGGYAVYGGGVYCYGSSPSISENFIVGNECGWGRGGPGIYCGHGSGPTIYRNLVANCSGPAAIFLHVECSAQVINNTVCDNTWGGISIQGNSGAYVKNNIFCNNVDYGIHVASGSSWYVGYNDVFGQNNNYVGDMGDQTGIEGNISADPLFENPSAGDYHLTLGSPCIDAGDPPGVDMGAFESPQDPNFTITAVPQTAMVCAGDSVSIKLILFSHYGFNSPVNLTYSSLPPGVTGLLNPDQLIPTDSSIFRLYTTPDATPGIHPITITADGGEIIHEREVVLGVVPPAYSGPVWYVSTGGNDLIGNGSEEFPFRTIQKGIDVAAGGDTVLVERGTYVEHVNFIGKGILVASHFIFDDLEATVESTVIDGDSSGVVVTFNSGEDASSVIRGFTITNGYTWGLGGGIFCYGSSPTISENFIVGNECGWGRGGPGIYCGYGSGPTIYRNLVVNCIGPAAVFLHVECSAQVINNTVCDNTWGGISIQGNSGAYVKNNIF
ncbi:MAG: right-handed parallel beta-helix repeat-containing protein, partial [Candidatus Zixiibacteriota bacterium]